MDYLRFVNLKMHLIEAIAHLRPVGDNMALNVRCPHCGDSKTKSKRRGFFLTMDDDRGGYTILYKCHNGGCEFNDAMPAESYLYKFHRDAYDRFKLAHATGEVDKKAKASAQKILERWEAESRELSKKRVKNSNESIRTFQPLTKLSPAISAVVQYLKSRHIPESVWSTWGYCPPNGTAYTNRIIIPYPRRDTKGGFFQARTLAKDVEPRYLTRYGVDREIYNMDFVDTDRPVFVLEGVIDSLFVENSVALTGIGVADRGPLGKWMKGIDKVFFMDGDEAGVQTAIKLLKKGEKVVSWERLSKRIGVTRDRYGLDCKDVNGVVCHVGKPFKFTYENAKDMIVEAEAGIVELNEYLKAIRRNKREEKNRIESIED